MSIILKIYTPEKVYTPHKADKVVLPIDKGNLTVLHGRAPRSQVLKEGVVQLLDENNNAFKKWHVGGGVAEIAQDVCQIAVEDVQEIQP